MKHTVVREYAVISVLAGIFVILSFSQTIAYIVRTPQGFIYPMVHNYVEDYYYYIHLMRQGFDGAWAATSRLTPEIFPPQFVNPFFLFLGHIARMSHLSLPVTYTLARVIGGMGVIGGTYILIRMVFPDSILKRIITFVLMFTSTYFWGWGNEGARVAYLVHEWTELDPLFRLSYIPHHLLSKVFMMITFLMFLRYLRSEQKKYLVFACFAAIVAGFLSPVVLATMFPLFVLWFVIELVGSRKKLFHLSQLASWVAVLGSMLLVAIYHRVVQHGVFPWTSYLWWEKVHYHVTVINYLQSLGPTFFLFLFGIPLILKKKFLGGLLLAWTGTSFVTLFLLAPYVPLTNSRYLGGYQFIPLGIGASVALFSFSDWVNQRGNTAARYIVPLFICLLLLYNGVGMWTSWKEHEGYIAGNRWNTQVFVPNDIVAAFAFLNGEAKGDVIVAPLEISTMIPAFTSGRVISGHKTITYEYDKKNRELSSFYSERDRVEAEGFLKRYNARYVLVQTTGAAGDLWYKALGLANVYNTPSIEVYKVP